MADTYMGNDAAGARQTWWWGTALVGVVALLAWQLSGTREVRPAPDRANVEAVSQHCQQFVAIARASFGPNWKPRLDPRDPLCAKEIQKAWEVQRIPRAPLVETPPPTALATPVAPPAPVDPAPPSNTNANAQSESSGSLDTYCLNVLGLARTKYGDDWPNYVTSQEATECQSYAQKMR